MELKDSGNRRQFESGAVRDIAEGKGRCDLLPLDYVGEIIGEENVIPQIAAFMDTGDTRHILLAISRFIRNRYTDKYSAILELAKHYEDGCRKYGDRNWEKGIPLHCYIDSGVRHYLKYLREDDDEPHDRAFLWNMIGLLWTLDHHPELNDLPFNKTDPNL